MGVLGGEDVRLLAAQVVWALPLPLRLRSLPCCSLCPLFDGERAIGFKSRAQPGWKTFGSPKARKRLEVATNPGPQSTTVNVIRETVLLPSKDNIARAPLLA
jgi:hypothetical protein